MTEAFPKPPRGPTNEEAGSAFGSTKDPRDHDTAGTPRSATYDVSDDRDPGFLSKMQMHSQETPQSVIDQEQSIIKAELNLSEDDEITFDDEGWDSRVYLVNGGETAYKFPRAPGVVRGYPREISALKMLKGIHSEVITQRFKALDSGNRYFSYAGVMGTKLSVLLGLLEEKEKQRVGSTIGSFLKELHVHHLGDVPIVTIDDEIEEYQSKYRLALPIIESSFSPEEQSSIAGFFFEQMPAQMGALGSEMRLCHGDLGSYNIVLNNDSTIGIIDFGNVGYYDQSKDFIDFGDEIVLDAALGAYGDSALLRAKAAVRTEGLTAIDLVYYMSKKNSQGIGITIEKLRSLLPSLPYGPGGRIERE